MALDFNSSRFILWLRANGISLGDVLTVGRLGVFVLPELLESDARKFGVAPAGTTWREVAAEKNCDGMLKAMGAESVRALDFSDYEGASVLHDLNRPLVAEKENCCDLLLDGGSLEHVFNVPEALKSYVKLVRPGGWIVLDMPIEGRCGHGFYQFSPELFHQFFGARVGCEVAATICVRDRPDSPWFLVPSPAESRQRVEPIDAEPLHLFVLVRRRAPWPGEEPAPPFQADYLEAWKGSAEGAPDASPRVQNSPLKKWLSGFMMRLAPIPYWRSAVARNDRRRYSPLGGSDGLLPEIDPFTWRLDPSLLSPLERR